MKRLDQNFLIEIIKACVTGQNFVEIIKPHLSYTFLPNDAYKSIFKYIFDFQGATGNVPTIGLIAQNVKNDIDTMSILSKASEVNITDKKEYLIDTLEIYIRKARFVALHNKSVELYESGKDEKAFQHMEQESRAINEFTLKTKLCTSIFDGFVARHHERKNTDFSEIKFPLGLPPFDHHTKGGVELGTSLLAIARSGVGKSTFLRWLGFQASLSGFNVLHFQAEGYRKDVEEAYDAMWTGQNIYDIKRGFIEDEMYKRLMESLKHLQISAGNIYVHAYEQFNQASIADCRNYLIDMVRETPIHVGLFDYLEKFSPGDGISYGATDDQNRNKKLATAEKIVNIATEFNMFTATATQASNIEKKFWNNPNFYITREDISNLKATIDPFAYCLTLNQTMDEYDNDVIRIHEEKLRHHRVIYKETPFKVAQGKNSGRFVNMKRTYDEFWDDASKTLKL